MANFFDFDGHGVGVGGRGDRDNDYIPSPEQQEEMRAEEAKSALLYATRVAASMGSHIVWVSYPGEGLWRAKIHDENVNFTIRHWGLGISSDPGCIVWGLNLVAFTAPGVDALGRAVLSYDEAKKEAETAWTQRCMASQYDCGRLNPNYDEAALALLEELHASKRAYFQQSEALLQEMLGNPLETQEAIEGHLTEQTAELASKPVESEASGEPILEAVAEPILEVVTESDMETGEVGDANDVVDVICSATDLNSVADLLAGQWGARRK